MIDQLNKVSDFSQSSMVTYEGRSINKLQNSVILLVFQIYKIPNIHFVAKNYPDPAIL